MKNPTQEIKNALPELENTKGKAKTITIENWDNRIKTIQTKIRNKYKVFSNIGLYKAYLNPCILEYNSSYGTITFNETKYKLIRKYLLSDEFNQKEEK